MARKEIRHFILCLAFLLFIFSLPAAAVSSEPARIKVLIIDDLQKTVPGMNEEMDSLGNMNGTLHANGASYTGNIEVWRGAGGLYIINELPLEEYIGNVVAAEIDTSWEIEAVKAQAVIARTYAVHRKSLNENSKFHITSSVLHQAYKGNNPQIRIAYAVRETAGEVLVYDGRPIEAFYHSTCGGRTEDAAEVFGKGYPYTKPVESTCSISPYWMWERKVSVSEIEKALNINGIKGITISSYTATKRAKELLIETETNRVPVKATEFRKLIGWKKLPSTNFSLSMNGDSVIFDGRGYGHGVGLCQWSALQMARDGRSYKEILAFFYPNTEIKSYEGN